MAEFKVSAERVEIIPHPNAERLEIAKVGMFSLVIAKGQYVDGDIVVIAPKRAILPEAIRDNYKSEETGASYLKHGTTVRSIRLRGELSEAVTLDKEWVMSTLNKAREKIWSDVPEAERDEWLENNALTFDEMIGRDLSEPLGIVEDIPVIPAQFAGVQANIKATNISLHDCEAIRLHSREFEEGEPVVVSEKIHGTQINVIIHEDDTVEISSKGLIKKGIVLENDESNVYWRAFRNSGLLEIKKALWPGQFVQFMGEVVPAQKGFDYGQDSEAPPVIFVFRVEVDRVRMSVPQINGMDEDITDHEDNTPSYVSRLLEMWVPWTVMPFSLEAIEKMAKGMEGVSGKQRHIKEGVVIEPETPRGAKRGGWPLIIKVINPKYKGDDEDMS